MANHLDESPNNPKKEEEGIVTARIGKVSDEPVTVADFLALNAIPRFNMGGISAVLPKVENDGTTSLEMAYFSLIKELSMNTTGNNVIYVESPEDLHAIENGIVCFPTVYSWGTITSMELMRLEYVTNIYRNPGPNVEPYVREEDLTLIDGIKIYIDSCVFSGQIPFLIKEDGDYIGAFRIIPPNITNRVLDGKTRTKEGIKGEIRYGEVYMHEHMDKERRNFAREGIFFEYDPEKQSYTRIDKDKRITILGEISQLVNTGKSTSLVMFHLIDFLKNLRISIDRSKFGELLRNRDINPAFAISAAPRVSEFILDPRTRFIANKYGARIHLLGKGYALGSEETAILFVYEL